MGAPTLLEVQGVRVPPFLYGTAWKEDATAPLTRQALDLGFRGIDTANQRRHYFEAAVGEAVQGALKAGRISRDELFIQTKFTYRGSQDHRLPYDPDAPPERQVEQSFASSLEHLGVERLDGYLLHGPSRNEGISHLDVQTWSAMEDLQRAGRARLIGISNVSFRQLEELYKGAKVKPTLVQNRTFTRPNADRQVRAFCKDHGILYEGFSLLTGSRGLLSHPTVKNLASRTKKTPEQIVFRFALEQGWVALTGTTSAEHMREDLAVLDFELATGEVHSVDRLVAV